MAEAPLAVSDHFPSIRESCKEVAATFFFCFSSQGQQINGMDALAGERGLKACQEQMKAYDECMKKYLKSNK